MEQNILIVTIINAIFSAITPILIACIECFKQIKRSKCLGSEIEMYMSSPTSARKNAIPDLSPSVPCEQSSLRHFVKELKKT